ncbi:hypothetical protein CIHG_04658 [Coccidioides immitis H538.4]|uniref:Uncharacterized protein n=3 Tax=Coccidioides immitis TaxID=5501 RepID=A0A0J8TFD9_COCIT|nr:hypothetical protein CIRG_08078 [Coccidioides immitis RMSCC 2394]KMU72347.1 hypothetical protein CISG_02995 [Coccidioides immitis RMSCC 3703]KMU87214.1 hypothetical protein CIHG_04658 [Coccidioides immitis H538.4]
MRQLFELHCMHARWPRAVPNYLMPSATFSNNRRLEPNRRADALPFHLDPGTMMTPLDQCLLSRRYQGCRIKLTEISTPSSERELNVRSTTTLEIKPFLQVQRLFDCWDSKFRRTFSMSSNTLLASLV